MRATASRPPTGPRGRRPAHSAERTLLGTVVLAVAFVGALVAVSYPVAAAVAVVAAAVAGVTGRSGARVLRRRVVRRRREGRARTVCVPATDVCVEA